MRVDCETWTYTALKETTVTTTSAEPGQPGTPLSSNKETKVVGKRNDLVIEQKIQLDQALYSTDSSSDTDESAGYKSKATSSVCCLPLKCGKAKIRTDKRIDINFEIVNVSVNCYTVYKSSTQDLIFFKSF